MINSADPDERDEFDKQIKGAILHSSICGDGDDQINGQGSHDTLAGNQGVDVINGLASEINENFTFYQSWVDSV
ncbi:MAG: hypothetical protein CMJ68_11845 [Planctomycetaceae bacterium]|nr:hypothetical protein [Planctomycetaceae bacterium]